MSEWSVNAANKHETRLEWIVWVPSASSSNSDGGGDEGEKASVVVDFERGGVVRCTIPLDGSAAVPVTSKL